MLVHAVSAQLVRRGHTHDAYRQHRAQVGQRGSDARLSGLPGELGTPGVAADALLARNARTAGARANLRQLLRNLRRAPYLTGLEIADARLRWPVSTDVAAFRAALHTGDMAAVIDLYTGPLLGEFDLTGAGGFGEWLIGEREGLFFAYRGAVLARARTLRQRGALEELAELLGQLLHHDPFDEDVLCEQLGALMEAGHFRRALAAYEAFRARLRRELDAAPGKATRELATQLRDAEGKASDVIPQRAPEPPPALPLSTPDTGTTRGAFVGRLKERDALRHSVADPACRLLSVVGPGGVGKTRLAVELASELTGSFRDGVTVVMLEAVSDARLVAPAIAARLGLTLEPLEPPEAQVAAQLKDTECLLVLDNFEQLLDGKAFLTALLENAPGVKLLVTSRERLNIPQEELLELRGLSLVGDGAGPSDAVTLFLYGARRVGATLRREADLELAADICALVEGVPLALELTSAWLRLLTPLEIKTELSAGLDLLVAPDADLPERHRNMRLVLARSWARLESSEQRTLARLSVFRGGFNFTAAKAVTGMSLGVLLALTHKSLLYRATDGRFTLHELVRQYAAEQLLAEGEAEQTQAGAQHARHYLGLLGTLEMWSEAEEASLAVLDAELDNLRVAWAWAAASGRLPEFWVPSDVVIFFDRRMRFSEGLGLFERASACFDPAAPAHQETLATLRVDRAWLLFRLRRYAEAEALAGDSLDASLSTKTRMKAYNTLGIITRQQGRYEVAVRHIEEALALARELGEVARIAAYLNNLGGACIWLTEYEKAEDAFRGALNLHQAADDVYGVVTTLIYLSAVHSAHKAFELTLKTVEAALRLAYENRFDDLLPLLLLSKAEALCRLNDLHQAECVCKEVLRLIKEVGGLVGPDEVFNLLGRISIRQGDPVQARRYLTKGFLLAWRLKNAPSVLQIMLAMGELELSEHTYIQQSA